VRAKIAAVIIKGEVFGTNLLGDHFGIVAEEIGKLKISGTSQPLARGPANDATPILLGATSDVAAREVGAASGDRLKAFVRPV
jgi:hypothetical protein